MSYATVDVGTTSVVSNVETESQLRDIFGTSDAPATADTAEATASESEPVAETAATPATRDAQGRFTSGKTADESPATGIAPEPAAAEPVAASEPEPADDPDIDTETGLKKSARPYKLVRQYQEQAQAAQRELAQMRAQMAQQPAPTQQAQAEAQAHAQTTNELGNRPRLADFPDWEQFEAAQDAWDTRFREKVRAEARASAEQTFAQREQAARFDQLQTEGRAKYPDFDAVLDTAARQGAMWSPLMTQIVLTSPTAIDLAYALAKDPGEARRLAAIADPTFAAFEMGQFVTRVATARSTGPVATEKPKTAAIAPLKPVGASPLTTDEPPGESASAAEHARYWNAKERSASRR